MADHRDNPIVNLADSTLFLNSEAQSSTSLIHIAAACDDAYAMPLAAMLCSLADNLGAGQSIVAHIIFETLSPENQTRLQASVPGDCLHINWTPVGEVELASMPAPIRTYDHISSASYFRLLLPKLLPAELDRVIYLDCDLIILCDIGELWHINLDEHYAAAVPELCADSRLISSPQGIRLWRELGLHADLEQFNCGVLLINLDKWRAQSISQRSLIYLTQAADWVRWHDQEALNVVFAGNWLSLDARWNLTMRYLMKTLPVTYQPPCIIHYHSAAKPWHADYPFALREVFLNYLDQTAWAGWRPRRLPLMRIQRFGNRLQKAIYKRQHAFWRLRNSFIKRFLAKRLLTSRLKLLGNPLPEHVRSGEIRIFMIADDCSQLARKHIEQLLSRGGERILVAINANKIDAWYSFVKLNARVHLVTRDTLSADAILRVLLHQYGQGHWCLITKSDEWFRYPGDDQLSLTELTRLLDLQHCTALMSRQVTLLNEKHTPGTQFGSDNTPRGVEFRLPQEVMRKLPMTERDWVHNRVFIADSYFLPTQLAETPHSAYRSAISLLRYDEDMLISTNIRSIHGSRLADIHGLIIQAPWLEQTDGPGQICTLSQLNWHVLQAAGLPDSLDSLEHVSGDPLRPDDQ